jgi:hypothetical protein
MDHAATLRNRSTVPQMVAHPDVSLHFLGHEGVLFDAGMQRLYAANTTATFIWCCLEEELRGEEIAARLEETFSLSSDDAAEYLTSALQNWQDLGLIGGATGPERTPPSPAVRAAAEASGAPAVVPETFIAERAYRLLDTQFQLRLTAANMLDELSFVLSPLVSNKPATGSIHLDIVRNDAGYSIICDGGSYRSCESDDQLVPLIKTSMIELALERSGDFGAVHAAGVGRAGQCVLLPAVSGTGKSTLTAALVAAGLDLLGDDTIVLDADNLAARPVPFAICVKEGAWPLLSGKFPDLAARPVHNRLDGKRVRYLVREGGRASGDPETRWPVRALAFIRRVPNAEATLVPISQPDALSRLTAEFCLLDEAMTTVTVEKLIAWISGISCFELRYSDLDGAVAEVKGLLA